jgi:hypothetical protein
MQRFSRTQAAFCACLLLALFFVVGAQAQTTLGSIIGTATDSTGAVVEGASVVVRNVDTNTERRVSTSASGHYEVHQLVPGNYEVVVSMTGFRTLRVSNIVLQTASTVRADARLEIGEVSTQVEVEGSAPVINTEGPDIGSVRAHDTIVRMPMNSRGTMGSGFYGNLAIMTPGAQAGQGSNYSFAGTRGSQWGMTVDGITQGSPLFGNAILPAQSNMEITGEVRVQLANDKAESATPGGIYATTKSGTNEYHGSAFYYLGDSVLNARNTFQQTVPNTRAHNFGGSLGGPIKRNKTFFFGTYEQSPTRAEYIFNSNLPTPAFREGNFSSLTNITVTDPFTNTPFQNNIIPRARLVDAALKAQEIFYPLPNSGGPDTYISNWRGVGERGTRKKQYEGRVDHNFSESNSLFARVSYNRGGSYGYDYNLITMPQADQRRYNFSMSVSDTHIFSPTLINEFRGGIMRERNPYENPFDGPALVSQLGLQGMRWNSEINKGMPVFNFNNFTAIGASDIFQDPHQRTFQLVDNLTWTKGNHTTKMGVEFRWNRGTNFPGGTTFPGLQFGVYSFTGAFSRFDYADFLLGLPQTATRSSVAPAINSLNTDFAWYVQDDWKVSRKLTLNIGVRYDFNPPYHERDGYMFNFVPELASLVVPDAKVLKDVNPAFPSDLVPVITAAEGRQPKSLWRSDKNNFAPRFGFAYRPLDEGTMVIRGGYGIYYDYMTSSLWRVGTGGPFVSQETFTNVLTNGQPWFQFPTAFPEGFGAVGVQSFSSIDPDFRIPYIQQWNLTVEREVKRVAVRASYIGTNTRKLTVGQNINQPLPSTEPFSFDRRRFPYLNTVNVLHNGGTHNYHSLHLTAERKTNSGLYFQAGWTWAKALTDVHSDGDNGATPLNSYNRLADYGNASYIARHRVVGTVLYDLPFGPGKPFFNSSSKAAKWIAGGWTISTLFTGETGLYFSPSFNGFDTTGTNITTGRPDRIRDGNLSGSERIIQRWFDVGAFVVPGDTNGDGRPDVNVGRFGNSGANILQGPSMTRFDMGLHKRMQLNEKFRIVAEATFQNAFNTPIYGLPASNIRAANAGLITSTRVGPRTGQLGFRLEF